nr:hypothetical protein [Sphingopyxis terrae]
MTAKREVRAHIGADGTTRFALQAILNLVERLDGDQRLVLAEARCDIPRWNMHNPRIDRVREYLLHAFIRYRAIRHLRDGRLRFKEAHHFGLRCKPTTRKSFECFTKHRGERFIMDEHFAAAGMTRIPVAPNSLEYPETLLNTCCHAVERLLCILLPRVLTDTREQILDQLAV